MSKKCEVKEEPEPEMQLEPEPEPEMQPEPEPELEMQLEPEMQPEPELEMQLEPELEIQLESEMQLDPEPEPEMQLEPEPDQEMQLEPEPEPEIQLVSEPQLEIQLEPQPGPSASTSKLEGIEIIDLTGDEYECEVCHQGNWVSETDVEIHRKDVHKEQLKMLYNDQTKNYCGICTRPELTPRRLLRHIKTEHLLSSPTSTFVEREIFFCDECEAMFFNKKLMAMHYAYTHTTKLYKSKARIECAICSKDVRVQNSHLWSHFFYHNFINIATCKICLTSCTNKEELKEHMKTHKKYERCSFCHFSDYAGRSMEEHASECHRKRNETAQERGPYMRYFIGTNKVWQVETNTNSMRGTCLPRNMAICVLCRAISTNEEEMKKHIEFDHLA